MSFRKALSILSKSSPYAVSTEKQKSDPNLLDELKEYLYIETDIENDFAKELSSLTKSEKKLIFLCGSSGDGKSEILTRYQESCQQNIDFHLDATHSFKPESTAIQTLDELFRNFSKSNRTLVVGINTGMLGNYAEEGEEESVKEAIKKFLDREKTNKNYTFLDFESYPKFNLALDTHTSDFVKSLLERITSVEDNILRRLYEEELALQHPDKILCTNYQILSIPEVQDVIIDVLFKARLVKDQFLTARALLDFIFNLIAGPYFIYDNLFLDIENELSNKIVDLDPVIRRAKESDMFILAHHLNLEDRPFDELLVSLKKYSLPKNQKPESFLRLFYLLGKADVGNNYHKEFSINHSESLLMQYSNIWRMHNEFDGDSEARLYIRKFYKEVVINSLHKYINKNAPYLVKGQYLLSEHNGIQISSEVDIKPDFQRLETLSPKNNASFIVCLKVRGQSMDLTININLLDLMNSILSGYRPNKNDKNSVVLLDKLADGLIEIASKSETIFLIQQEKTIKITKLDEEELEVSGI